jgi:pentatricopeptide repeat protein
MSPDDKIIILKGERVLETNRAHDIIAIEDKNGIIWVIDPTVWQFFPSRKDILICKAKNFNHALQIIHKMYECEWSISEELLDLSDGDEQKYLRIIADNFSI